MANDDLLAILFLIGFSLVMGFFTARTSHRRDPIAGGPVAAVLHYLASALWSATTVTVLIMVFFVRPEWTDVTLLGIQTSIAPLVQIFGIAFGMVGVAYVCLLGYALLAKPELDARARTNTENAGWTEADARTSGL